jgi:hypothetical protein
MLPTATELQRMSELLVSKGIGAGAAAAGVNNVMLWLTCNCPASYANILQWIKEHYLRG